MKLDSTKIYNVKLADVHHWDSPDYVDAYIVSAEYDGRELTDSELDEVNEDRDFVYEKVLEHLY